MNYHEYNLVVEDTIDRPATMTLEASAKNAGKEAGRNPGKDAGKNLAGKAGQGNVARKGNRGAEAPSETGEDTVIHVPGEVDLARAWEEFATFLRNNGARITQARKIVFHRAMARTDHYRADDLAHELATGPDRVSRATVYHTLTLMARTGFVRVLRDADRHVHYERGYGRPRHDHMVCERCGMLIEFNAQDVSDAVARACGQRGFWKRSHRVIVFGICRNCAG